MVNKENTNASVGLKKEIDLERIALTTFGYGLIGTMFPNQEYTAPLLASVGLAASTFDEVKKKGWNLARPAAGILVGGTLGYLFEFNANEYLPHIATYSGAAIGGALGFYKSICLK